MFFRLPWVGALHPDHVVRTAWPAIGLTSVRDGRSVFTRGADCPAEGSTARSPGGGRPGGLGVAATMSSSTTLNRPVWSPFHVWIGFQIGQHQAGQRARAPSRAALALKQASRTVSKYSSGRLRICTTKPVSAPAARESRAKPRPRGAPRAVAEQAGQPGVDALRCAVNRCSVCASGHLGAQQPGRQPRLVARARKLATPRCGAGRPRC